MNFSPIKIKDIVWIEGVNLCSNIYAIGENDITIVDTGSGDRGDLISHSLRKIGLNIGNVSKVILTHSHFDHVGGLIEILNYTSPTIFIHPSELEFLEVPKQVNIHELSENQTIHTETMDLKVLHTPGHTCGSVCLYDETNALLFTGDTVFPGGSFGRTDLPTGDENMLIKSLKKLSELKVEIMLPGHDKPVCKKAYLHIKSSFQQAKAFFGVESP
jgi:glyoxylase-like metal-dependent hydrolase (beta-lactamase superfamily II)